MAARAESVAKYICEQADWKITNLELQKIMYLSQMIYMGRNAGDYLFDGDFEAWDYGPVIPELYHKVKQFGAGKIRDVFNGARSFKEDDPRRAFIEEMCEKFLNYTAGQLVSITHHHRGAWYKRYVPRRRGIKIFGADMLTEYNERLSFLR